jgi:hypothetical protein
MNLFDWVLDLRGEFETPEMIAEIGPAYEPGLRQIRQITVNGRAIEARVFESIAHLGVRKRTARIDQRLKNRCARSGRTQARCP